MATPPALLARQISFGWPAIHSDACRLQVRNAQQQPAPRPALLAKPLTPQLLSSPTVIATGPAWAERSTFINRRFSRSDAGLREELEASCSTVPLTKFSKFAAPETAWRWQEEPGGALPCGECGSAIEKYCSRRCSIERLIGSSYCATL
jgi:hypothetical protein